MKILFTALVLVLLTACASTASYSDSEYEKSLEEYTQRVEKFDGIQNVFTVYASLLNEAVLQKQNQFRAKFLMWSEQKQKEESEALQQNLSQKIEVFLSFYTPVAKNNDLDKAQSIWRVFLDSQGKRYVGTVSKMPGAAADIKAFYPHHEPWSSGYMVTFPVSAKQIQVEDARVLITSSLGSGEFQFKKLNH